MFDLLIAGSEIAVSGMVAVFSLLGLLVLAMKGMSGVAAFLEGPSSGPGNAPSPSSGGPDDPQLAAAVTAAIHAHRSRTKT